MKNLQNVLTVPVVNESNTIEIEKGFNENTEKWQLKRNRQYIISAYAVYAFGCRHGNGGNNYRRKTKICTRKMMSVMFQTTEIPSRL